MENKKLNEKESLELISQMIQNTRTRVEKDGGTPFLIWGVWNSDYFITGMVYGCVDRKV